MAFNSPYYLLFLPLVYLCFSVAGQNLRWLVLLLASYGFYASFQAPQLLVVLWLVTLLSHACGVRIGQSSDEQTRRRIFWLGTSGCLLLLALLKYLPPLLLQGKGAAAPSTLFVSIGVSYFCFQAIAYLADVYLEVSAPEPHLGYHALSLAFFPKLLQGPIERASKLLPQLREPYRFDYQLTRCGLVLFVWGMFKKVVIADRLAGFVNSVYGDVAGSTGFSCLLSTYFYAVQLYCDFSGYTDMALGSAMLFGIRLSPNFNKPYLATSIADFWRRWHISFSSWILDYIFRPLQMQWRDWGRLGTSLALMITFLVSGLWHGAGWGYLTWGGLHGGYLAFSIYYRSWEKKFPAALRLQPSPWKTWAQRFLTFQLVCFAWIFFRAGSMGDAWAVIGKIGTISFSGVDGNVLRSLRHSVGGLGMTQADMMILLFALVFVALVRFASLNDNAFERLFRCRAPQRWSFYLTLALMVILLRAKAQVPYLYFRF